MDERNADAYAERAYAWVQLEDYDNALADANEAIRLNPNGEIAYCQRGRVWLVKEDYDRAVADFNQAIRLYPTDSGYYYNRGLAWEGKRSYDRAITDFGEAIRLNPNDVDVYSELAWIQATCPDAQYRDGQKAFENASRAYQLDGGKHWRSLNALAAAYAENGDFAAARNWQAKAIELAPNGTFKIKDKCRYRLEFYNKGEPFRTTK
jgi:tetratricopeptide (TPR) repeat protein